jgi:uncharacterized membrane protein YwzB
MVKVILYAAIIPLVIWCLESLRLDILFKKNRQPQIKMLYVLLAFAFSYLVVNCLYDFSTYFRSIM